MVKSELFQEISMVVSSFAIAFGTVAKHEAEKRVSIPLGMRIWLSSQRND
jgi:hypothetical protein